MVLGSLRGPAFVVAAAFASGCAGGSAAPGAPALAGNSPLLQMSERADIGATGAGKVPQRFVPGAKIGHSRAASVACTTVSPSADVLSALSESGSTATAAYVLSTPNVTYTKQDFDGSECDMAVYVAPTASNETITDSNVHDGIRAGLVVDGASHVRVFGNALFNVGDHNGTTYAPDGVQWGFAIMLVNAGTAETVGSNSIYNYQKEGILAFDNVVLALSQNDITGAGPIPYIASNGVEMDGVKFTSLTGNRVSLNQYTGPTYGAAGYLFCGDTLAGAPITKAKVKQQKNVALYNDIELYVSPNSNCS